MIYYAKIFIWNRIPFSFYVDEETNTSISTIVTNKHVIENAINGKLLSAGNNKHERKLIK